MNVFNNLWTGINSSATNILILLLTTLSILELLDMYGINVKWFSYSKRKREKERKEILNVINEYINNNKYFFMSNTNEYISYILTAMGLKHGQLDNIFSSVDELRKANAVIKTKTDMERMIDSLLMNPKIILDLTKSDPNRKVIYPGLRFYIDLTDNMNINPIRTQVIAILNYYIETILSEQNLSIRDINRIVIPTESNVIMGIELADLLGIEPVIMHNKRRRIYEDQYWDGSLPATSRVLIVHDVIYSGDNIVECINRLPKSCAIVGVISIANRTDKSAKLGSKIGKGLIEETGVKVYSAMDVNDDYLMELRRK